jgi:flagellar hook-associated protein 3 FlgL
MRITNTMIMTNADNNINGVKIILDKTNTQMTTQKKIDRPSEDPVIAVRSLRFSTSLAKVNQFYEKNIPDAESWIEVTETALVNMRDTVRSIHSLSDQGANDTLTQDDRKTLLSQLKKLQEQLYDSGNSDYAGRTVFTGYRTNKTLTFMDDETNTSYDITEKHNANSSIETYRYYSGKVTAPSTKDEINSTTNTPTTYVEKEFSRMRLGYDDITFKDTTSATVPTPLLADKATLTIGKTETSTKGNIYFTQTQADGTVKDYADAPAKITVYDDEKSWEDASTSTPKTKEIPDGEMVYIKSTGELLMNDETAAKLKADNVDVTTDYTKTGFKDGELRPEYYYNCVMTSDKGTATNIEYQKYDTTGKEVKYDINYTVAANQELSVNLEASDVFDSSLIQDMNDMTTSVSNAIEAYDKVEKLKKMKTEVQFQDDATQANLDKWISSASREMDFANSNLQKVFNKEIGNSKTYESKLSLSLTDLGCRADQLSMTKKQMSDQQETIEDLQSKNDDYDLSEVGLKYTAAYTAYKSSLTAAGKLGDMTLLNYL